MNQTEKNQVSKGLSDLVSALENLAHQPIASFSAWPNIGYTITNAHNYFIKVLEKTIDPCKSFISNLNGDYRPFKQWQLYIEDLWERVRYLRSQHNRMFGNEYSSLLYHHILIEELLNCFPQTLPGAKCEFLLVPMGELKVWAISQALANLLPAWIDKQYLDAATQLETESSIECFGCHRDTSFSRQAILTHEIFHIIVQNNDSLIQLIKTLSQDDSIQTLLETTDPDNLDSQIEELYCDFAANWFFGPIYLQSFADEISYYRIQRSDTHPTSDLRAKFLLVNSEYARKHPGFSNLKRYMELRKKHLLPRQNDGMLRTIGNKFADGLHHLGLDRFSWTDQTDMIRQSFKSNIPYVSQDVRALINNLPADLEPVLNQKYFDLVSESLRKINLFRQAKMFLRDPDALFAVPEPILAQVKPKKRG